MLSASKAMLQSDIDDLISDITKTESEISLLVKTSEFFYTTIETRVTSLSHKIEHIINSGLSYIYGESFNLKIQSRKRGKRQEFFIELTKNGVTGLSEKHGGGVLAVVSLLFKIVFISILKHNKLSIFDESLSFVSKEYQLRLSEFLNKLSKDMGLSIVVISHQPLLSEYATKVYVSQKDRNNHTKFKSK
ncbi:hypothetical protein ThvES_00017680 [Thiovulum sp. ES]|nr:hypothetical protein ThvES_00017680 [Thiovulum sp. ES]